MDRSVPSSSFNGYQGNGVSLITITNGTSHVLLVGEKYLDSVGAPTGSACNDDQGWTDGWDNDSMGFAHADGGTPIGPQRNGNVTAPITTASWSGGTATINVAFNDWAASSTITISGAVPAAWNGTFQVTAATSTSLTFSIPTNPGPYGGRGSININSGCGQYFGSNHPSGIQVVLCDGSVRSVSYKVDASAWQTFCQASSGAILDTSSF